MKSIIILLALVSVALVQAGENNSQPDNNKKIRLARDFIDESIDIVNLILKYNKLGYLEYHNPNLKSQDELQEKRQNRQEKQQQQKELQKKLRQLALQQQLQEIQNELE